MVILLADDDVGVRFFVRRLLKADGFTVLTAGDGKAALEASRNFPGSIDLMLSDVENAPDGRTGTLQKHCGGTPWDQSAHDVG
jgi:DNA-binding response OmpR family regulator